MKFRITGWTEAFATTKNLKVETCPTEVVGHDWFTLFVGELRLSHQAHLFLIQGGQLNRLFLASSLDATGYPGNPPFFLLHARYPDLWEAPYIVRDVVLGKLAQLQDGMDLKAVITKMASFHLKSGFRRSA